MHIQAPPPRRPPTLRRRSRRLLAVLAGSVLLHAVVVLVLLWARPALRPGPPTVSDDVSIVFDHPSGATQASTPADAPSPEAAVASGRPDAPLSTPSLDTESPAPPPPAPEVASAEPPAPVVPPEEAPAPPLPAPSPPPAVEPPKPAPPPSVSLRTDTGLPPPPDFVMPEPPPPLPPLAPRPPPPRIVARPRAPSSSPFSNPQDWSFNGASRAPVPGQASRGMDFSLQPKGGNSEAEMQWVAGARPSGDWGSAFHNWAQARVYYPEAARVNGIDGTSTVLLEIDRSGRVLSVRLASTSHSPFLDGAWIDIFRNAQVPPFTPDMTEPTITMRATLVYRLIRR